MVSQHFRVQPGKKAFEVLRFNVDELSHDSIIIIITVFIKRQIAKVYRALKKEGEKTEQRQRQPATKREKGGF